MYRVLPPVPSIFHSLNFNCAGNSPVSGLWWAYSIRSVGGCDPLGIRRGSGGIAAGDVTESPWLTFPGDNITWSSKIGAEDVSRRDFVDFAFLLLRLTLSPVTLPALFVFGNLVICGLPGVNSRTGMTGIDPCERSDLVLVLVVESGVSGRGVGCWVARGSVIFGDATALTSEGCLCGRAVFVAAHARTSVA